MHDNIFRTCNLCGIGLPSATDLSSAFLVFKFWLNFGFGEEYRIPYLQFYAAVVLAALGILSFPSALRTFFSPPAVKLQDGLRQEQSEFEITVINFLSQPSSWDLGICSSCAPEPCSFTRVSCMLPHFFCRSLRACTCVCCQAQSQDRTALAVRRHHNPSLHSSLLCIDSPWKLF